MSPAHLAAVPTPAPVGRLLTPRDVAARLAVSTSMVRKLHRVMELPAIYVGRLPRFEEAVVEAYLQRQRAQGAQR